MTDRLPRRVIDFNRILVWLNAIVAGLTILVYTQIGGNDYIDGETIVLATLLAFQTHVALFVERRRRDPFVILFAFILVAYYSTRILSLLVFPFSVVLDRFSYRSSDSNHAVLFILAANSFLYAGFFMTSSRASPRVLVGQWRARAPLRALLLVIAAIVFVYTRGILWNLESVPRVLQFLLTFLAQSFVLLMALTYFAVFRQTLDWRFASALLVLLVLEMVLHTLAGSRSAIVVTLQNVIIVTLAVAGTIEIRRRFVLLGVALMPVMGFALIVSFTISSYVRAFGGNDGLGVGAAIELSQAAGERLTKEYALESGLPLILSRAGFFDYSAEIIAHSAQYQRVVNIPAYLRSITDNLLTPGYDVFDQAKISNSLRFVYADLGRPSKIASGGEYQSDQLGIYGELFVLFGYASLPLFFVGAALFKRAYRSFNDADPLRLTIKRVVTLSVFAIAINSFGLDWMFMDLVTLVTSIYIYRYFFATVFDVEGVLHPAGLAASGTSPSR